MNGILAATLMLSAAGAIPDGSLLVLRNSNKPVEAVTGSEITHVAILFQHGQNEWVYEATPGQTRRLPWTEYRRELGEFNRNRRSPLAVSVLEPKQAYSAEQVNRMRAYAASQIGRRYSLQGYVRGKEVDGIHCAHFAASILETSGRFRFEKAYAISPGKLVAGISKLHKRPVPIAVDPGETNESWCEKSWTAWFNYGAWCRWACYETWTFCR